MKKTIIYTILTLFLVTTLAFKYANQGDDSKQIMTITQQDKNIIISTPTEIKEIKGEKTVWFGVNVLTILSDYQKQGWVVKNTNVSVDGTNAVYYFYLEK